MMTNVRVSSLHLSKNLKLKHHVSYHNNITIRPWFVITVCSPSVITSCLSAG